MADYSVRIGVPSAVIPAVPTDGLLMDFDAAVGLTTGGGVLTQWNDQSGNSNHGIDPTNPPTVTTDYRGRPIVRFTGSQQFSFGTSTTLNAESVSIFLVGQHYGGEVWLRNYAGGGAVMRNPGVPDGFYLYGGRDTGLKFRSSPAMYGINSYASSEGHTNNESATGLASLLSDSNCDGVLLTGGMDVRRLLVYTTKPAIADVRAHLNAKHGLRSTPDTKHILFDGDSITAGLAPDNTPAPHLSFASQAVRTSTEDWRFTNRGSSGSTIAMRASEAAVTDSYIVPGARNVLHFLIGRNDAINDSGSTIYTNLVDYVQDRVAAGWEVWVGTAITTSNPTFYARLQDFNARIRGTTGAGIIADAGASKVVDYGALPEFDGIDDSGSALFNPDGTHPNKDGGGVMADLTVSVMVAA